MGDVKSTWLYIRKNILNDIIELADFMEILYLCGKDITRKKAKQLFDAEMGMLRICDIFYHFY